jgi:cytoskeletal protein RodZ
VDVGGTLKKARVLKKLTLADVEEYTKIRTKYLEAMEENHFAILPPGMYGSAFLRTYARFLELDADELLASYRETSGVSLGAVDEDSPYTEVRPSRRGRSVWGYLGAVVVLAAAVGFFNHRALFAPPSPAPPPSGGSRQAQQAPPAGGKNSTGQVAISQGLSLVLSATNDYSWYSVTVDNGTPVTGFIYAGQQKNFRGATNINLTLGNAGSVKVRVNGQNLGYLGGQGTVVQHNFASTGG